jgi:hypothetical protein
MYEVRVVAAMGLGLLAGALLTEAAVLVPYWRTLSSRAFVELHQGVAPRLYAYFAPVTSGAVLVALASAVWAVLSGPESTGDWSAVCAGVSASALLGFYGLYFAAANRRLPEVAALDRPDLLARELNQWRAVHHIRTAVCIAAFVCALVAL